jgi:hypothetical protein
MGTACLSRPQSRDRINLMRGSKEIERCFRFRLHARRSSGIASGALARPQTLNEIPVKTQSQYPADSLL